MKFVRTDFLILAFLVSLTSVARADDPPAPEPLPSPTPVEAYAPDFPTVPYPAFVRPSRYAVWQNYGVDRHGFFRPLVVYSPYGPYVRQTGQAFPWAQMHPLEWMPYVVED